MLGWAVREGVTNVLRHSEAATAQIRVVTDGAMSAVLVEDDGRGIDGDVDAAGAGRRPGTGIAGLRERATALGGTVEAGPLAGRGWRLRVAVPADVRASSADPSGAAS